MPLRISTLSLSEGSATVTGWKRRSSAASFSMCLRYSLNVVAPMTWISPRESAGLRMFAAFMLPSASPAPTRIVHLVDDKDDVSLAADLFNETLHARLKLAAELRSRDERSEIEQKYLLVAQLGRYVARGDALRETSAIAVLPTPGSPMRQGLFFWRRLRIWMTRSNSSLRPIIRSSLPRGRGR